MREAARRPRLHRVRRRSPRGRRGPAEGAGHRRRTARDARRQQPRPDRTGDRGDHDRGGIERAAGTGEQRGRRRRRTVRVPDRGRVALGVRRELLRRHRTDAGRAAVARAGRGRIVHIGSIGGRIASAGLGPYSASKHALEALAESQRQEFARSGSPIRVALIEPGEVATAIWDKADASVDDIERTLDVEGTPATSGCSTSRAGSSTRAGARACRRRRSRRRSSTR